MALSGLAGAPSLRGGGSKRAVASFDDDFDELFGGEDEAPKVSVTPAFAALAMKWGSCSCRPCGARPVILRNCSMAEEAAKRA